MKECSAFICKYGHGNRYNDLGTYDGDYKAGDNDDQP